MSDALMTEVTRILRCARPISRDKRKWVIESTAQAVGIEPIVRAFLVHEFHTDDLGKLDDDQLIRAFEFTVTASEMLRQDGMLCS